MKKTALLFVLVFIPAALSATPLKVKVLSANLTTNLRTNVNIDDGNGPPRQVVGAQNKSSPFAISNSQLSVEGVVWAQASADLFDLFVFTASNRAAGQNFELGSNSGAEAFATVLFAPEADQTATLQFLFTGWAEFFYSRGSLQLRDVTTNQTIWSDGWTSVPSFFHGTHLWDNPIWLDPATGQTSFVGSHAFNRSHVYELSTFVSTDSDDDTQSMRLQVSGVEAVDSSAVPEPSSLVLLTLGLVGLVKLKKLRLTPSPH